MKFAGLRTRILSMIYEGVLLTGLLTVATGCFIAVFGDSREQPIEAGLGRCAGRFHHRDAAARASK